MHTITPESDFLRRLFAVLFPLLGALIAIGATYLCAVYPALAG